MISCFPGLPIGKQFFLDASVMVKLFVDENGSKQIRGYVQDTTISFFTTNFCYFETLSVLKGKWKHKKINHDEYIQHCSLLFAYKKEERIKIMEYPLTDLHDFGKLERLTKNYGIDISDALQLLSIKETVLRMTVEESETTLITGDKGLAEAAKKEGVKYILI